MMRLLAEPDDGIETVLNEINEAKTSVKILIFRMDRMEVESALVKAVSRGVAVRALIAFTNRGGEGRLRALEMRLLAAGVTVARTDNDLVRYHGKMMIVDDSLLYLMAFNLTHHDTERSRSFSVTTDDKDIVGEALKLFEADSMRTPYEPALDRFIVSPLNARDRLSDFIRGAKTELLIYDPEVADPAMIRILSERCAAGVQVHLLGRLSRRVAGMEARKLYMRLHARVIVRDRNDVFMGSQSLRTAELDARREVGLIFQEPKITARISEIFESDWKKSADQRPGRNAARGKPPVRKVAKKVARTVVEEMPAMTPVLEVVTRQLAESGIETKVDARELEATVKDAVKAAIQEAVASAVQEAAAGADK